MTSTTTPSTTTPDPLIEVTRMMLTMQRESQREMKDLVLSILQGRPTNGSTPTSETAQELSQMLLTPNYDDDSIPLPRGIDSVFEREAAEEEEVRRLRTEQEGLARQLAEARMRLVTDPQGPDSISSS